MSAATACAGVLVVEDDADITEALVQVLESEGMAVRAAGNGQIALDLLRAPGSPLPCVILLDLMMPVMDGWTFRSTQLRDPTIAHIPVVILTAGGPAAVTDRVRADAMLRKPVDLETLLATLARYVT
ncbi:MAG TPA: response regulator [Polyangia bacterium]|nr:response regulator [Polyangia bacterium]